MQFGKAKGQVNALTASITLPRLVRRPDRGDHPMTKRALVLIIVCIGLAAGWFLMNEDPAPKAKVSKAKQATQKVKKDSKKPSEHECPREQRRTARL